MSYTLRQEESPGSVEVSSTDRHVPQPGTTLIYSITVDMFTQQLAYA